MHPDAVPFAHEWIQAWNGRDVEKVLAYYADGVVFTSPTALRVVPASGGVVRGKAALRSYWVSALDGHPDLHFELEGVYEGIDTIVLHYRNETGILINEVLTFEEGFVTVGHATHICR